jgi:hypothetical protein|tara:strand:+ start:516 stop:1490 length:975 start_codon:yes stop_codon:yes gene_type:complete
MSSTIKVNNIQNLAGDDSGFDLSTNDKIGMKIANSEVVTVDTTGVVFNENSANRDFRVESDGNTHALFIDAGNDRVGVGTSSPDGGFHVKGMSDHAKFILEAGGTAGNNNTIFMQFHNGSGTEIASIQAEEGASNSGQIIFKTGGTTEAMRIDKDSTLLIGRTVDVSAETHLGIEVTDATKGCVTETGFSANTSHFLFINPNGIVGAIKTNGSATSYVTSSDYRLKENVVTDWDATTRLKELKPSRFNFKADKDTTVDGFLAHEVSSIVPEAISGEKDEVDADGNPEYQGIDQSKLVPLLTKALQEAVAKIETLEAKVTALEGK